MKSLSYFFSVVFTFGLWGCESCSKKPPQEGSAEKEHILVSETYTPLLQKEAALFTSLYPQADLTVAGTSTEEAIVHFLNDSVHIIVVDRSLTEEERALAQKYSIVGGATVVAYDALAVLTHTYNPLQKITRSSIKKILTGEATNWRHIPEAQWEGSITVVVPNKHSGLYTLLQKQFFQIPSELAATVLCATQEEAIRTVSQKPQAIAFVSFYAAHTLPADVKIVAVETTDDTGKEKFLKPTQENIYEQLYPFYYSLYLYTRESKSTLGTGFGTFLLTYSGQKIIQDSGSVPVKIPSRPIQLTVE